MAKSTYLVRTCEYCQQEFKVYASVLRHRPARYCSVQCRYEANGWKPLVQTACPTCGEMFAPKSKGPGRRRKYCSRHCYNIATDYDNGLEWASPDDHTMRGCQECGRTFIQSEGSRRLGFCSSECLRRRRDRIHTSTRRLRIRQQTIDERFDPLEIFERDRWICQLCGVRTLKRLSGMKEDRSPELDHIVPLSKGGAHTRANVQCLCHKCNLLKGTRIIGQLRFA